MAFDFTVDPYVGVGRLRFGMSRHEVVEALGPADKQVEQFGGTVVDYYNDDLISLSYDDGDELEFVEWHASNPGMLLGQEIDDGATGDIVERIAHVAGEASPTDAGVMFELVGLVLYAPSDRVGGIAVYRRGYFDPA